jgi:hypothetical protein
VKIFGGEVGREFSRESLMEFLNGVDDEAILGPRRSWLDHNRRTIARLLGTVEEAAHSVSPGLPLGFMTGDRLFEGYDFRSWAHSLQGDTKDQVRWRPGGGFYWDDCPLGMVEKAHDIGRQVAALPDEVTVIQSEVENFPYHVLKKSVRATMLEAAAHMAAGATGLAFNVLGGFPEPLDEYIPFLEAIRDSKEFFRRMHDGLGRLPALGIFPAWNQDLFIANGTPRRWLGPPGIHEALARQYVLCEIGLPMCYGLYGSTVTTLSGSVPLTFTEEKLVEILSGGTFLDAPALHSLEQRGLGHLAGVHLGEVFERDALEAMVEDPINGDSGGRMRNCRQSFWDHAAYRLEPDSDQVSILARLQDYGGRDLGPCMSAWENDRGGRVVVSAYSPWKLIHNEAKSGQLKRIFSWLARDKLPAVVESYAKVIVWARGRKDEPSAFLLLNASLDRVEGLRLRVLGRSGTFTTSSLGGDGKPIRIQADPGQGCQTLTLDHMGPWSACYISRQ